MQDRQGRRARSTRRVTISIARALTRLRSTSCARVGVSFTTTLFSPPIPLASGLPRSLLNMESHSCDTCPKSYKTAAGLGQHRKRCANRVREAETNLAKRKAAQDEVEAIQKRFRTTVEDVEDEEGEVEGYGGTEGQVDMEVRVQQGCVRPASLTILLQ